MFRRTRQTKRLVGDWNRRLRFEPLEGRRLLAGVVKVIMAVDTLKFEGDNLSNEIEVRQTDSTTAQDEFEVVGKNGTMLDTDGDGDGDVASQTFAGINNFDVKLKNGDDIWKFLARPGGSRSELKGNVCILNELGQKTNGFEKVEIRGSLKIDRPDADNFFGKCITSIVDTEVRGDTDIITGKVGKATNGGDTDTTIRGAELRGNFTFQAREGSDLFNLEDSNIRGNAEIYTTETTGQDDPGSSRITITSSGGTKTNVVEGTLEIITSNYLETEDVITLNRTETESAVTINTGDGPDKVLVQQQSKLGTDLTGGAEDLRVTYGKSNANQRKLFELKGSMVQWNAKLNNDGAGKFDALIEQSEIGVNTGGHLTVNGNADDDTVTVKVGAKVGGNIDVDSKAGDDRLDVIGSEAVDVKLTSAEGDDVLHVADSTVREVTHISTTGDDRLEIINTQEKTVHSITACLGAGDDTVWLEKVKVQTKTVIKLGDDNDLLHLLAVNFLGTIILDGGAGEDTFEADQAAINAYLVLATEFEHVIVMP